MVREVLVPDIGDYSDVDIIEIAVREGDIVKFEDTLITIETEKATMDIPAPFAGTITKMHVAVGNKVNSGSLIGRVGKSGVTYAHLHCELYRGDLDLKDKPWRYYPIGWSKEMIIKNWLPLYTLIEKFKTYQPPVDPYIAKFSQLKISIDRLQSETAVLNSQADKKSAYEGTMAKVKKISDTGSL